MTKTTLFASVSLLVAFLGTKLHAQNCTTTYAQLKSTMDAPLVDREDKILELGFSLFMENDGTRFYRKCPDATHEFREIIRLYASKEGIMYGTLNKEHYLELKKYVKTRLKCTRRQADEIDAFENCEDHYNYGFQVITADEQSLYIMIITD